MFHPLENVLTTLVLLIFLFTLCVAPAGSESNQCPYLSYAQWTRHLSSPWISSIQCNVCGTQWSRNYGKVCSLYETLFITTETLEIIHFSWGWFSVTAWCCFCDKPIKKHGDAILIILPGKQMHLLKISCTSSGQPYFGLCDHNNNDIQIHTTYHTLFNTGLSHSSNCQHDFYEVMFYLIPCKFSDVYYLKTLMWGSALWCFWCIVFVVLLFWLRGMCVKCVSVGVAFSSCS